MAQDISQNESSKISTGYIFLDLFWTSGDSVARRQLLSTGVLQVAYCKENKLHSVDHFKQSIESVAVELKEKKLQLRFILECFCL